MLYQYKNRTLYYFENDEKKIIGTNVSNYIQISLKKDKLLYITNSPVWDQGDLYIKEEGKSPRLLGKSVRIHYVSTDFNRILFQEHYNSDFGTDNYLTGNLCLYLNLEEKVIIDTKVTPQINIFIDSDKLYKVIYTKKTHNHSVLSFGSTYDLFIFDQNSNRKIIAKEVLYGVYNVYNNEVDDMGIVFFVRNDNYFGNLCVYENDKISIKIKNISTNYKMINQEEHSNLIVDFVNCDYQDIINGTTKIQVSIGTINIYKDFNVEVSIVKAYSNFYFDGSYSKIFYFSDFNNETGKFSLFEKDLLKLEKTNIKLLDDVDINNFSIKEYLKTKAISNHNDFYTLYYSKKESKKFHIASELAKEAFLHTIIPNDDPFDESENHKVVFTKEKIHIVAQMVHVLSGFQEKGYSLMGTSIYGLNINGIIKACSNVKTLDANNLTIYDISYQLAAEEVRDKLMVYYGLKYKSQLKKILLERLKPIQSSNNSCRRIYYDILSNRPNSIRKFKELASQIEERLIVDNKLPAKWKSEQELFKLFKDIFPTARIHYSPNWLRPQHLDIFIPEIHLAVEYQGIQHFTPVNYFGGEDDFKRRINLDIRKKELCIINKIRFLEWYYNEPITKTILKRKLDELGIKV